MPKRSINRSAMVARKRFKKSFPPHNSLNLIKNGEVKHIDFVDVAVEDLLIQTAHSLDISAIANGTSKSNRLGTDIHILGYEVSVFTGDGSAIGYRNIDSYVCTPTTNTAPGYLDFIGAVGGLPVDKNIRAFDHRTGGGDSAGPVVFKRTLKYPLKVIFGGTGTFGIRNRLFVTLVNNTTVPLQNYTIAARVYFQDT